MHNTFEPVQANYAKPLCGNGLRQENPGRLDVTLYVISTYNYFAFFLVFLKNAIDF